MQDMIRLQFQSKDLTLKLHYSDFLFGVWISSWVISGLKGWDMWDIIMHSGLCNLQWTIKNISLKPNQLGLRGWSMLICYCRNGNRVLRCSV
ncbi:hypothetical protein Pint_13486 [Pistacia integerrima]|uniref:Uncharacterized protein n=1 Tax=Pistacia integerrima TaxID=434235 RepID=A0ACC0Y745_9ROSI|nr:hypothetical protein Pint_13486 [Pistacia integerrima]